MVPKARYSGYRQVNRVFTDPGSGASPTAWQVRFFRPQEKEEYRLWIDAGDGRLFAWEALFAEETPGADPDRPEAAALAAAHMRRFGLDPDRFTTVETSAEKLPGRTDHRLVFEALPQDDRHVGQALFRVEVRLAGPAYRTCTVDHGNLGRIVRIKRAECMLQLGHRFRVQGVASMRPVDCDGADAVLS